MNIHGICIVKNESDIIAQSLRAAREWCDFIYVLDNGSTDGTWEIIQELAKEYREIVIYRQDFQAFRHSLRREVFEHYRKRSSDGDWWCARLDSDEFYIDDPRIFLAQISKRHQVVWSASFQYYFTDKDLERYDRNPTLYADDKPVEEKCRYYQNDWSEGRFFRYENHLIWPADRDWPICGAIYTERIRLKHYKHRSPKQIQLRLQTRLEARAKGSRSFSHESQNFEADMKDIPYSSSEDQESGELGLSGSEWRSGVVKSSELVFDHSDEYSIREDLMPRIPLYKHIYILGVIKVKALKFIYFLKDFFGKIKPQSKYV